MKQIHAQYGRSSFTGMLDDVGAGAEGGRGADMLRIVKNDGDFGSNQKLLRLDVTAFAVAGYVYQRKSRLITVTGRRALHQPS
jgi:hypothetical protein